jgi:hypothetical protein
LEVRQGRRKSLGGRQEQPNDVSRGVGIASILLSMSLLMRMWGLGWWEMADVSGFEVVARAEEVGHGGVWLHRTARKHVGSWTARN